MLTCSAIPIQPNTERDNLAITGEVFKSVEEAANSIGISRVALSLKLTGKTKNKTNLNYL